MAKTEASKRFNVRSYDTLIEHMSDISVRYMDCALTNKKLILGLLSNPCRYATTTFFFDIEPIGWLSKMHYWRFTRSPGLEDGVGINLDPRKEKEVMDLFDEVDLETEVTHKFSGYKLLRGVGDLKTVLDKTIEIYKILAAKQSDSQVLFGQIHLELSHDKPPLVAIDPRDVIKTADFLEKNGEEVGLYASGKSYEEGSSGHIYLERRLGPVLKEVTLSTTTQEELDGLAKKLQLI